VPGRGLTAGTQPPGVAICGKLGVSSMRGLGQFLVIGCLLTIPVVIYQSQPPAVVYEIPQPPEIRTSSHQGDEKTIYLIALKGQDNICAAQAYCVTQNTLHFITLEGEAKQAPISAVDRALPFGLNRDRRVDFRLPPDK
jgi:hypothetical protein